jgi:curved DNA-binding protein
MTFSAACSAGRAVRGPVRALPGARRRYRGRDHHQRGGGARGGAAGNLHLVVHIAPHPRYRFNRRDITVDLPVTPWEAALGAKVPVGTPGGVVQVDRPARYVVGPAATPARPGTAQPARRTG